MCTCAQKHTHTHTHAYRLNYAYTHTSMHTYIYACIHPYIHTDRQTDRQRTYMRTYIMHMCSTYAKYIHIYIYIYICICIHVYMYVCMYVCIYVCMYICTHIYIYIYVHTHIHVHTQPRNRHSTSTGLENPLSTVLGSESTFASCRCRHRAAERPKYSQAPRSSGLGTEEFIVLGRRAKLRLFWGYRSGRSFKVWIQASGLEGWGSRSFKAYVCLGSVSVGLGRCEAFRVQGLLGSGCFFQLLAHGACIQRSGFLGLSGGGF